MTKYFIAIFAIIISLFSLAHSADRPRYDIVGRFGPSYQEVDPVFSYSNDFILANSSPSPSRICFTSLVLSSTNSFTAYIADSVATRRIQLGTIPAGNFTKEWPMDDPLCLDADSVSAGNPRVIIHMEGTPSTAGSYFHISYQGFISTR